MTVIHKQMVALWAVHGSTEHWLTPCSPMLSTRSIFHSRIMLSTATIVVCKRHLRTQWLAHRERTKASVTLIRKRDSRSQLRWKTIKVSNGNTVKRNIQSLLMVKAGRAIMMIIRPVNVVKSYRTSEAQHREKMKKSAQSLIAWESSRLSRCKTIWRRLTRLIRQTWSRLLRLWSESAISRRSQKSSKRRGSERSNSRTSQLDDRRSSSFRKATKCFASSDSCTDVARE